MSLFREWHWCSQLWANQLNVTTWQNMFLLLIEGKTSFLCYTLLSLATKTYNLLWGIRNREISLKATNLTERRKKEAERRINSEREREKERERERESHWERNIIESGKERFTQDLFKTNYFTRLFSKAPSYFLSRLASPLFDGDNPWGLWNRVYVRAVRSRHST